MSRTRNQSTGRPRRSLSGKLLPPGHTPAPMWEDLVRPAAPPTGTPGRPWNTPRRRVVVPACPWKCCYETLGHDGGMHGDRVTQAPTRRGRSDRFDTVRRSPRMRHGTDERLRTDVVLRVLNRHVRAGGAR